MKYQIDKQYLLDCFKTVADTPSPVGFYTLLNPVLEQLATQQGEAITYDNKSTPYITLEGQDNSKTVLVGAHSDTIGLIIRKIDANGWIRVRQMGGINYHSLEGETVTVHTRDGRSYTGLMACQSHSVHVFDDARTMPRDEEHMMILLDEPVKSKADVNALGIRNGDFVSIEPRVQVTPSGYLKSRFIDDKAAVACVFAALKYMKDSGLKPKYKTLLAFPYYEEIGQGGVYVPPEVSEYVAIDIGLIGPDYDGNEHTVSICAKDVKTTYDYDLVTRLVNYAEKAGCDYAVDVFYRYSTDAAACAAVGNNVKAAAFGMPVYCSHGMERTHWDSLANTTNLILAYLLDI